MPSTPYKKGRKRKTREHVIGGVEDFYTDITLPIDPTEISMEMYKFWDNKQKKDKDARKAFMYDNVTNFVEMKNREKQINGLEVLRNVQKGVHEFKFILTKVQLDFIEQMIKASLRQILGTDYDANIESVMEENGWDEALSEVLICAERKKGKSTCVAIYGATMAIYVPKSQTAIFSVALRNSKIVQDMIVQMVRSHPLGRNMIVQQSALEMTLEGADGAAGQREIHSFPGQNVNVHTVELFHFLLLLLLFTICYFFQNQLLNIKNQFFCFIFAVADAEKCHIDYLNFLIIGNYIKIPLEK